MVFLYIVPFSNYTAELVNNCIYSPFALGNSIQTTSLDGTWVDFNYLGAVKTFPEIDSKKAFLTNHRFIEGANNIPGVIVT